jgi:hypothetical protein
LIKCSVAIRYFIDMNKYVIHCVNDYPQNCLTDREKLKTQLFEYHMVIGVDAYEADLQDLEGSLKWKLQGEWYSTAEIERIINLRAFL